MSDTLKPLSVKTEHLATKSVTSEKIADKVIENRNIKEGAVTPDKLSIVVVSRPVSPPIESSEIKDGAIKTDEIAGNAVTADKIAPNSITAEKILDGAVTREKIRDGAVTKEKMADGTIGTAEIIDGAVTTAKLATSSVTAAKIAAGAVKTSEIADGSVTTPKIADGSVTPEKLSFVPGGGGNKYVPRAVATWDKTRMSFEFDGVMHEDGMDLSGIVPPEAVATHLIIEVSGPQAQSFQVYANQVTKICNSFIGFIQGMGGGMGRVHCVIYNDPDRLFDYLLTPGIGDVAVAGWYI